MDSKEDRCKRILLLIADEGPLNKYRICERLIPKYGSEPTILYSIKHLENLEWLAVAKTDRNARGPAGQSKYYELTVVGLAELISLLDEDEFDHMIDALTKKYASLMPGILDVWPMIKQAGVQDIAQGQLRRGCADLLDFADPNAMAELVIRGQSADLATLVQEITHDFWDPLTIHEVDVQRKWLRGLSKNASLRQMVVEETLSRASQEVNARNGIIRELSGPELTVKTAEELQGLQTEIKELREALYLLELATNRKVV